MPQICIWDQSRACPDKYPEITSSCTNCNLARLARTIEDSATNMIEALEKISAAVELLRYSK